MPKHLGETRPRLWDEIPPDDGCEVAPKCLECPLPQCKYDDPWGYLRQLRQQRDAQMLEEIYQRGLTFDEAAKVYGVSARTIYRASRRRTGNGNHEPVYAKLVEEPAHGKPTSAPSMIP